jgi:hypothetical protein
LRLRAPSVVEHVAEELCHGHLKERVGALLGCILRHEATVLGSSSCQFTWRRGSA